MDSILSLLIDGYNLITPLSKPLSRSSTRTLDSVKVEYMVDMDLPLPPRCNIAPRYQSDEEGENKGLKFLSVPIIGMDMNGHVLVGVSTYIGNVQHRSFLMDLETQKAISNKWVPSSIEFYGCYVDFFGIGMYTEVDEEKFESYFQSISDDSQDTNFSIPGVCGIAVTIEDDVGDGDHRLIVIRDSKIAKWITENSHSRYTRMVLREAASSDDKEGHCSCVSLTPYDNDLFTIEDDYCTLRGGIVMRASWVRLLTDDKKMLFERPPPQAPCKIFHLNSKCCPQRFFTELQFLDQDRFFLLQDTLWFVDLSSEKQNMVQVELCQAYQQRGGNGKGLQVNSGNNSLLSPSIEYKMAVRQTDGQVFMVGVDVEQNRFLVGKLTINYKES